MSATSVVLPATSNVVEDPGHAQAMIDKANGVTPAAAVTAPEARPAWLPEKFKTAEDMAASYKELEARQGAPKTPEAAPAAPAAAVTPVVAPAGVPAAAADDPAAAVVATAGLDMAALQTEFAEAGALSDASLAKLAAAGVDKATVDSYIAGRTALANAFHADVLSVVPGGADKYTEMVTWAAANLTAAEIAAYNTAINTPNADQAKLAVAGLGAKFTASVGLEPNLEGGRGNPTAGDVYASVAQWKSDIRDPRYAKDQAFRDAVVAKLGRSPI